MRELAYIQKIKSLTPIAGADKIEKAEVLGWELVVKKGEFKVGDLCVYCEIDSILPEYPCFEFLRPRKFRIKTLKLRGQISQGIAFPLSILNEVDPTFPVAKAKVGEDVTEVLKIVKHDPEVELDEVETVKKTWFQKKTSYWKWKLFGFKPSKSGDFPNDVPKTDETRVQKMASALEEHQGQLMYVTEKVEGTSATFVYRRNGNWLARLLGKGYTFLVCSRNRIVYNSQKGGETTHHNMRAAQRYNLLDGLKKLDRNLAIQGEVIGPKIQGNIYKIPEVDLRVFLMYDLDTQQYLTYHEMLTIADQLKLQTVPILYECVLENDVKYYVELSKGTSVINPNVLREGIVIRSKTDNFSFKSINPEYLLHQEL
jgi:hypothetical protein